MRLSGRTYQNRRLAALHYQLDVLFPRDAPSNSSWHGRNTAAKPACLLASVLPLAHLRAPKKIRTNNIS